LKIPWARAAGLSAGRRAIVRATFCEIVPQSVASAGNASASWTVPAITGKGTLRRSEESKREAACGVMKRQP
jgi:hypothetical protein